MTIDELKILLDIDNPIDVLKSNARKCNNSWLFVDSNSGQCYLFDKNGKEKDIHSLTKIDEYLFYKDHTLTKIVVPNSVTSIGMYAFYRCDKLTSVTIGNSVTSIGIFAFYGCSGLTSVTILDGITRIKDNVFNNCSSLTSMTIPDSVTSIGFYAFIDCRKLARLTFKGKTFDEVKAIKNYPFGISDESVIKCEA